MTMPEIIEEIKLELGCSVLDLEISDKDIEAVVKKAMREIERFWDELTTVTIPWASCIDLSGSELDLKEKVVSIVNIYRTDGYGASADGTYGISDPLYAQQWAIFSNGGTMYNLNDYVLNYASWTTLLQMKNTLSTDMAFKEDRHNNKLYINSSMDKPKRITIEYIPKITDVEAIQSDYWVDMLIRLSTALTKIVIGRIRTRYTLSNAPWTQDGEKILEEGNTEYKEIRDRLRDQSNYVFPLD